MFESLNYFGQRSLRRISRQGQITVRVAVIDIDMALLQTCRRSRAEMASRGDRLGQLKVAYSRAREQALKRTYKSSYFYLKLTGVQDVERSANGPLAFSHEGP